MDSSSLKGSYPLLIVGQHLTVALIALFVIGGATRVMEAGLACPDWPLCYGAFFPGNKMNIQVFLEWFHRLDAFLVSVLIAVQFFISYRMRKQLPKWMPRIYFLMLLLVVFQAILGALTVYQLLKSEIVTAHLLTALTLIILVTGTNQKIKNPTNSVTPKWWKIMTFTSLFGLIVQSAIGGSLSTTWSSHICLVNSDSCILLDTHKTFAYFVSGLIFVFSLLAVSKGGKYLNQWPYLLSALFLIFMQISLGILTIYFELTIPIITIGHQLTAALLVSIISTLSCMNLKDKNNQSVMPSSNTNQKLELSL